MAEISIIKEVCKNKRLCHKQAGRTRICRTCLVRSIRPKSRGKVMSCWSQPEYRQATSTSRNRGLRKMWYRAITLLAVTLCFVRQSRLTAVHLWMRYSDWKVRSNMRKMNRELSEMKLKLSKIWINRFLAIMRLSANEQFFQMNPSPTILNEPLKWSS